MSSEFRYDAFISYRHVEPDRAYAKWLHKALETYRVPKDLVKQGFPSRIKRVFRDEEELPASADLSNEINSALEGSKFLIVICSPRIVESIWCDAEVKKFRDLGRHDKILALLIEGEPSESFLPALCEIRRSVIKGDGTTIEEIEAVEPLAADVRPSRTESSRELKSLAKLRLLACILGCKFDDLRKREQIRRRRRTIAFSSTLLILLLCMTSLSLWALKEQKFAKEQKGIAEKKTVEAEQQRDKAIKAEDLASRSAAAEKSAKEESQKNEAEAIRQKSLAETAKEAALKSAAAEKSAKEESQKNEAEAIKQKGIAEKAKVAALESAAAEKSAKEESQKNEAKTRLALSHSDLIVADKYRWQRDYKLALAHLARSLKNNPRNKESAELAWALLTTEKLSFPVKSGEAKKSVKASFLEDNLNTLYWVDDNGTLRKQLRNSTNSQVLLTIPNWNKKYHVEFESPEWILLKDENLHPLFSINYKTRKIKKYGDSSEEETDNNSGALGRFKAKQMFSADFVKEVDLSRSALPENVENYEIGMVAAGKKEFDKLRTVYETAKTFNDILWTPPRGAAREERFSIISSKGSILEVSGAPFYTFNFIKDLNKVIIDKHTYYFRSIVQVLNINSESHRYSQNYIRGRVGTSCYHILSEDKKYILIYFEKCCYLFKSEEFDLSGNNSDQGIAIDLQESCLGCLAVDSMPQDFYFDEKTGQLLIWDGEHFNSSHLKTFYFSLKANGQNAFNDELLSFPGIKGSFKSLHDAEFQNEKDKLHSTVGGKSLIQNFSGPVYQQIKKFDSMRLYLIDDAWSARKPASRVITTDLKKGLIFNKGFFGQKQYFHNDGISATIFGVYSEGAKAVLWVPTFKGDIPVWLGEFIENVISAELDDSGGIKTKKSQLNVPKAKVQKLVFTWDELAGSYGYNLKK